MSFKEDKKIELMMALTCMAYCLCIRQAWKQSKHSFVWKSYRSGARYRAVSVFRMGLAEFERQVFCLKILIHYLYEILKALIVW